MHHYASRCTETISPSPGQAPDLAIRVVFQSRYQSKFAQTGLGDQSRDNQVPEESNQMAANSFIAGVTSFNANCSSTTTSPRLEREIS